MKYLILRLFNAYGPRMDSSEYGQVIPEFIRKIFVEPEFTIIGPGTQTRSFCYVDDNIEMTFRTFKTINNEIFNVGNDEEISIIELAKIMHEIVGKEFKYKLLPPREGDPNRRVPNINKLVSKIGYRPQVSLKEGLIKTIEWYKKFIYNNVV
jgi:nucleoside-diphosphate-sugar epimerase